MIKIANNSLQNCNSINEVIELINKEELTDASPELIAAAYALDACRESGYGFGKEEIEAHLDSLVEAGAIFEFIAAREIAIKNVEKNRL